MAKLILDDILSDYASRQKVNSNSTAIEAAVENTVSRDGSAPNAMGADFDMNSHRILNLPAPVYPTEPARLQDITSGATLTALSLIHVVVDTVTAMKAYTMSASLIGQLIYCRGYAAIGDGGEGLFRITATATTADNGIYFTSNTAGYYFVRQYTGSINLKWFGAKGDNVTDDYTAITNCITAAQAGSQILIQAPIGYYRTSRQLVFSGVGLRGTSKVGTNFSALQPFTGDSVIMVDDSLNGGGTDSIYENFRIYGNRAQVSTTVAGLKLYGNVLYNRFSDIRIDEARGAGILVEGKAGPVRPTLNTFTNVHVSTGDADGLKMNAGRHMTFADCAFENLTGKGINITGSTEACSKLTFVTPYLEHITGDGIYLGETDLTTIVAPLVNGYGSTGTPSYGFRNAGVTANLNELIGGQFEKNASPNAASHDVYIDSGSRFSGRRLNTTDILTSGQRGATFSNYQIAAASTQPLFFCNGRATIAAGLTRYLGVNGAQSATRTDVDIPIPGYTTFSQLRVSTTAVLLAGDTIDILVLVDGGVTALTCQLNNANAGRNTDLVNEAFFTPGQLLAVRVITSGAAPTIAIDGLVVTLGVRQA